MTQRIHNLGKWARLGEGNAMSFPNPRRRNVVLEINAVSSIELWVLQRKEDVEADPEVILDKEAGRVARGFVSSMLEWANTPIEDLNVTTVGRSVMFLAACRPGRDTIEFGVEGAFELVSVGGDCYVFSTDSQQHEHRLVDEEIYTRLANRRQRNPHLEMLMFEMRRNQQAFQDQLFVDNERRMKAIEEGAERYAKKRDQRAPVERSLAALAPVGERSLSPGDGDDAGDGATPEGKGRSGGSVSGDTDVSAAAGKPRGKAAKVT